MDSVVSIYLSLFYYCFRIIPLRSLLIPSHHRRRYAFLHDREEEEDGEDLGKQ